VIAHTRLYSCGSHYDGINYVSLMEPGEMVVARMLIYVGLINGFILMADMMVIRMMSHAQGVSS